MTAINIIVFTIFAIVTLVVFLWPPGAKPNSEWDEPEGEAPYDPYRGYYVQRALVSRDPDVAKPDTYAVWCRLHNAPDFGKLFEFTCKNEEDITPLAHDLLEEYWENQKEIHRQWKL